MCLQCMTDAKVIKEDILPGYSLMQAQKEAEGWPKDWYGLVECNNPTVVFPNIGLEPDLCDDLSDEEVDALPENSKEWQSSLSLISYARKNLDQFKKIELKDSWRLVQACIQAGYNPEEDGLAECWLLNFIAKELKCMNR